jgi:hypothetical protein
MINLPILLLCLISFNHVYANHNVRQQTQNRNQCLELELHQNILNDYIDQIKLKKANDAIFLNNFAESNYYWSQFIIAHMKSRFPLEENKDRNIKYGSVSGSCLCNETTNLLKFRIKLLEKWIVGTVEGDVCSGSYPVKSFTNQEVKVK